MPPELGLISCIVAVLTPVMQPAALAQCLLGRTSLLSWRGCSWSRQWKHAAGTGNESTVCMTGKASKLGKWQSFLRKEQFPEVILEFTK